MGQIAFGIGKKIGSGFGILMALIIGVGASAIWEMRNVGTQSAMLRQEYVPEVAVMDSFGQALLQTMDWMHAYGLSEDKTYYDASVKTLGAVERSLTEARELVARSPHLAQLKESLPEIEASIAEYERQITATVQKIELLTQYRAMLEQSAAEYIQNCAAYLQEEEDAFKTDIVTGLPPTPLITRLVKITLMRDVVNFGNETRMATLRALSFRDPEQIRAAQSLFSEIDQKLATLRASTIADKSLKRLEIIQASSQRYQATMNQLLTHWLELQTLETTRRDAANHAVALSQTTMAQILTNTETVAEHAMTTLIAASNTLFIGIAVAVAIGLSVAIGITHNLVRSMRRGIAFTEQIARGNLTAAIALKQRDEIGKLAEMLQEMGTRLREVVVSVKTVVEKVTHGSQQMESSAQIMSQGASEQAAASEQASSSIEQMTANIRQNADNAIQTEQIATKASEDAQLSGKAVEDAIEAMRQIARKITIIEEIARQNCEKYGSKFHKTNSMAEAFTDADIVYPKSWAPFAAMEERTRLYAQGDKDGIDALEKKLLAQNAQHKDWACTEEMMRLTKDGKALYLHCLPADITGLSCAEGEVDNSVFDRYIVPLYKQASYKPYIIAAMIFLAQVKDPVRALMAMDEGKEQRKSF